MTDYKNAVPKAQGGDPKALDELYRSTNRAVYFTCLSLLKNEQDAEDLMQNTYITAFRKLKTLEQPEKFEPWIKRIAANLCKDFLLKKGAHPSESLDEEGLDDPIDENFLPDEYVTAAEKREIVIKIMREQLSDVLYQTVIMFYFDEMSVATIAEEMNCPEGTVKYRLNAARAKIKKGVLDYEKKSGDKLYALAGIPGLSFLARLLIEESKAASVPALDIMSVITQNSPYIPDSAAVDPNFTANTATRIGGKMLGTLKAKIIAAAAAAAVVGGGAAAVIAVNNSGGSESSYTSRVDSDDPTNNSNSGSPNGIDLSQSRFWFARQTWDEPPRSWFEGGVLADKRDIHDVDLHKIDGISAPFYAYKVLDESKEYVSGTFEDVFNSQWIIEPGKHVGIDTQHHASGTPAPLYDGLGVITVFNFDDEPRTTGYCLEHNWWNNHQNKEYPPDETRALGLDHELMDTGPAPNEYAMLDAIKAKFGTPHYIRYGSIHEDDRGLDPKTQLFKEVEREFDPTYGGLVATYYDMIYDYGDILMIISVKEQIFSDVNNKSDVYYVEFWPRECWEHRKDIEPFYGGENDSEQTFRPYEGTESEPPKPVSSVPSGENDSPFWFARQTWNEAPRDSFEGGLLIDNRKTIDPEFLNDICAPYHCILLNTERHNADKFSEVLMAEEDIPAYNFADIYTQYVGFGEPYPEFSGVEIIRVFNLDNIPHSLYDCYENGWWKISVDENYRYLPVTAALGLPKELIDEPDPSDENALLDAMIEKFGTPHYIYYPQVYRGSNNPDRRAAIYEDMESILNPVPGNEMHFIQYQFVYEFENDIVMCVYISENRNDDGRITLNVDYVEFWSGACWENRNAVLNLDYDTDEIELFKVYP